MPALYILLGRVCKHPLLLHDDVSEWHELRKTGGNMIQVMDFHRSFATTAAAVLMMV